MLKLSMQNKAFFAENREYPTISSIPKNNEVYLILKDYIEIDECLFSTKTDIKEEDILDKLISSLEQNKRDAFLFQFIIDILILHLVIRPNQSALSCHLLSMILSNYETEKSFIIETIKENSNYKRFDYIKQYIDSYAISSAPKINLIEKLENSSLFRYDQHSLEYILQQDDVASLKNYIQTNPNYSINMTSIDLPNISRYDLLEFCGFYGSYQCFKFLETNVCQIGKNINKMSVAGGNFSIIHDIEQKGITFDECFEFSVNYHQHHVSDWLLLNYKCEILSSNKCLSCLGYGAFCFMLLNNVIDQLQEPLLYFGNSSNYNFDMIKYLVEHGANLNPGLGYMPILNRLCKNKRINIDVIKYLLEHGADVNLCYSSALSNLLENESANNDMVKYLIEHGADVNKGTIPPLVALCKSEKVNIEMIKYLIEHGADVNKGNIPPLFHLCQNKKADEHMIKYLIEHGANVNKEIEFSTISISDEETRMTLISYLFYKCNSIDFINFETIKILISNGAKLDKDNSLVNICIAPFTNNKIQLEVIQFLYDIGANINAEIKKKMKAGSFTIIGSISPLVALFMQKTLNFEAIKFLIEHGAVINTKNLTPLEALCQQTTVNLDAVKYLIEHGADVNKGKISPLFALFQQQTVNTEVMRFLIEHGADVNKGNPLLFMCQQEKINLGAIKLLVENGADVNQNNCQTSPLLSLLQHENIDIDAMKYLVENGADINIKRQINGEKVTPLLLICQHKVINIEAIEFLIDHGAYIGKGNLTFLEELCQQRTYNIEALKYFVEHGADVNNGNITPLQYLCQKETINLEAIKYLISKGADVNKGNITPLQYLCQKETLDFEAIKYLISKGADINKGTTTPLEEICQQTCIDINNIKYFIDHGADVNKGNPLVYLCQKKIITSNIQMAIKYLIDVGVDVNKGNKYTPLEVLCQQRVPDIETIKLLVEHGADVKKGNPLLLCCQKYKSDKFIIPRDVKEAMEYLIEQGADVNKGNITPLLSLCQQKIMDFKVLKLLVEHGADVNQGSITPLEALCQQKHVKVEVMKYLIDHGADVNKGKALLYFCQYHSISQNNEAIQCLIENGADVNKVYQNNDELITPLMSSCQRADIECIQYLVEHGADVNFKCNGITPIEYLMQQNLPKNVILEITNLLINHGAIINSKNMSSSSEN